VDPDGGRQGSTQQCARLVDHICELDRNDFLFTLATKGENLVHQVFCPFPCDQQFLQVAPFPGGRGDCVQRQFGIAEDGGSLVSSGACN